MKSLLNIRRQTEYPGRHRQYKYHINSCSCILLQCPCILWITIYEAGKMMHLALVCLCTCYYIMVTLVRYIHSCSFLHWLGPWKNLIFSSFVTTLWQKKIMKQGRGYTLNGMHSKTYMKDILSSPMLTKNLIFLWVHDIDFCESTSMP